MRTPLGVRGKGVKGLRFSPREKPRGDDTKGLSNNRIRAHVAPLALLALAAAPHLVELLNGSRDEGDSLRIC